jgi:hypothetical protein
LHRRLRIASAGGPIGEQARAASPAQKNRARRRARLEVRQRGGAGDNLPEGKSCGKREPLILGGSVSHVSSQRADTMRGRGGAGNATAGMPAMQWRQAQRQRCSVSPHANIATANVACRRNRRCRVASPRMRLKAAQCRTRRHKFPLLLVFPSRAHRHKSCVWTMRRCSVARGEAVASFCRRTRHEQTSRLAC